MAWSVHQIDISLTLSMGDSGSLEVIAGVKFKYHHGSPEVGPTYSHGGLPADPPEVDAIEVVSLAVDLGDNKREELPLTLAICEWIAETVDVDALAEFAAVEHKLIAADLGD